MVEFQSQAHIKVLLDSSNPEDSYVLFYRASMEPYIKDFHRMSMKGLFYPKLASIDQNPRSLCVPHHLSIGFQVLNLGIQLHVSVYGPKQSKFLKNRTLLVPMSFSLLFLTGGKALLLGKLNNEKFTFKSKYEVMVGFKRKR